MPTSNVQFGNVLTRSGGGGGGQVVQGDLSCPPPGIFSLKVYKFYFSQSEMLTSNFQLGYVLTKGGGKAVQGGISCPTPRISERKDNPQVLLHHLLQEYLVESDINIISVNLRC